ncbi:helix-turn-helix domain-containing protein [Nonomuraea sp. SMC257]|uniref:Helix-turn-helix domain-containing protein n=1 Tax=Nonomuraea montanisoli TaxID=2741721 RepID=A0A7Y6M804_9ACTN|nr:PucR family transcriptional regulator [Nonomuraea montanisoli]NUW36904.1 helix-turn-helix domain-containing protein [Nonomuraea montanisoli]
MFTLDALVNNRSLELRILEPGPPGALREPATWVHNTELPDPSPYLRERELVLTNGLWQEQVSPEEFVAHVKRARAAGIVYGLRAETPRTPPALVAACRAAGLPLLEISQAIPFTAVSQAVSGMYADERQQGVIGMVRRGDALATAISRGAGASGVLRVLTRDHDLPLAVVDRMGRLLAASGTELDSAQLQIVAAGLSRRPPALELDLGGGHAALFPVGALGDADAALICLRPLAELPAAERDALEQAARFLSLEVARQQAVQAIEMRFAGELLEMVLSGGRRASEVASRLQAFGVDPAGALAVCTLAFADEAAAAHSLVKTATDHAPAKPVTVHDSAKTAAERDRDLAKTATEHGLAEVIGEFLADEGVPAVVAGGTNDVVALLTWRHPEDELPVLAERLVERVARRFPGRRPVAGLGSVAAHAGDLRQPLLQSREACRVLRRTPGGPAVRGFRELGTHRLLLGLVDQATLSAFARDLLAPLRAHDAQRRSDLEPTLRAFLDHDGQWAATAAALHVHVNTLRNRLTRVTELTGRDVGRVEDLVDLFLALTIDAME